MNTLINKEQFLVEHNKLSPMHLQATLMMLDKFQEEKKPLLKDAGWSVDKLRIPFISWMLALPQDKIKKLRKSRALPAYKDYPFGENEVA